MNHTIIIAEAGVNHNGDIKLANGGTQVLILSGGSASSFNEAGAADVAFYVSGAIGSRGTATRGTSLFGGDTVISGTLAKVDGTTGAVIAELATPGIVVAANKVIEFGDPGENISGNGTNLAINSSADINLTAGANVLLDVDGEVILDSRKSTTYKDGGNAFLKISRDGSGNAVLSFTPVFGVGTSTFAFTIDRLGSVDTAIISGNNAGNGYSEGDILTIDPTNLVAAETKVVTYKNIQTLTFNGTITAGTFTTSQTVSLQDGTVVTFVPTGSTIVGEANANYGTMSYIEHNKAQCF